MEFKCLWSAEPVSECPPVKELNRLRADVKRLEEENRWLEEENRKLRERIPPQSAEADSSRSQTSLLPTLATNLPQADLLTRRAPGGGAGPSGTPAPTRGKEVTA